MSAPVKTRVWGRIEASDPPALRFDYLKLCALAEELLASRCERFPQQIKEGSLSADAAALEIKAFEHLVQNWRFITLGEGKPAGIGADHVLRAALDASLDHIAEHAGAMRGFTETLGAKTEAIIALRWHLEPGRETLALARLTQQLRANARAAQPTKEPAQ